MPDINNVHAQNLLDRVHKHFKSLDISSNLKKAINIHLSFIAEYKAEFLIEDPTPERLFVLLTPGMSVHPVVGISDMIEGNNLLKEYVKTLFSTYELSPLSASYDM